MSCAQIELFHTACQKASVFTVVLNSLTQMRGEKRYCFNMRIIVHIFRHSHLFVKVVLTKYTGILKTVMTLHGRLVHKITKKKGKTALLGAIKLHWVPRNI